MSSWFFADGEEKIGPISEEEILGKVAAGELNAGTMVWRETMEEWKPAAEVAELAPYLSSNPEPLLSTADQTNIEFPAPEVSPSLPVPARKKGCLGIILVTGGLILIAVMITGWLFFRSLLGFISGSFSSKPEVKQEKNISDIATRELIEALQQEYPQVKVESVPGKNDSLQLTNSGSGQSIILSIKAIQQGLIGGGTTGLSKLFPKVNSAASPDSSASPRELSSSQGHLPSESDSVPSPIPALPDWIPQPSDAKVTTHVILIKEGVTNGTFSMTSSQPADQSAAFFQEKMEAADYTVQRQMIEGDGGRAITLTAQTEEVPLKIIQLTITSQNSLTQISGSYTTH